MDKTIDLAIVGVQKAGTTSLLHYIKEHPEVNGQIPVEFSFFSDDATFNKGISWSLDRYFNWTNAAAHKIIVKCVDICQSEKALSRLKKHNPNCKIIFIMRDPVLRAYSSYKMASRDGWMDRYFNDILSVISTNDTNDLMHQEFLTKGFYLEQIKLINEYFPIGNIKIINFEDIKSNGLLVCQCIFSWLGIDDNFTPNIKVVHNKTGMAKSNQAAKIFDGLRQENNVLKKIIKRLTPYRVYKYSTDRIMSLNHKKREYQQMEPEVYKILSMYFDSHNLALSAFLNQNKASYLDLGNNLWLRSM